MASDGGSGAGEAAGFLFVVGVEGLAEEWKAAEWRGGSGAVFRPEGAVPKARLKVAQRFIAGYRGEQGNTVAPKGRLKRSQRVINRPYGTTPAVVGPL
jgi:hypothetical protein